MILCMVFPARFRMYPEPYTSGCRKLGVSWTNLIHPLQLVFSDRRRFFEMQQISSSVLSGHSWRRTERVPFLVNDFGQRKLSLSLYCGDPLLLSLHRLFRSPTCGLKEACQLARGLGRSPGVWCNSTPSMQAPWWTRLEC